MVRLDQEGEMYYDPLEEVLGDPDIDEYSPEEQDERISHAFASEGSALRAASKRNPRNLPCPTCGAKNRLTPADRAKGYQCDECADRVEGTYIGSDY